MFRVTAAIRINPNELSERFVRSPGPGGQHVNKTATAVELRFDAAQSPALAEPVRARLLRLAGNRANNDGEIIIQAHRYRSRERNREDARKRLFNLIRRAATPPRPRRKTHPSAAARERRLQAKHQRGERKRQREKPNSDDS
jgi:ribosome-associated protein